MEKLSRVHFMQSVGKIIVEILNGEKNHGVLVFPCFASPIASMVNLEDNPSMEPIKTFTMDWAHNWTKNALSYRLSGPFPGGPIEGMITNEILNYGSKEMIVVAVTQDIADVAEERGWVSSGLEYAKNAEQDEFNSWKSKYVYKNGAPYSAYTHAKAEAIAKLYGKPEYSSPKAVKQGQSWSNSGNKLKKVIPGLLHMVDKCPHGNHHVGCSLHDLVIHLNDTHHWPRSKEDKPPYPSWDMSTNIADWVEEYALKNNLDMQFRTPEEMEELHKKKNKPNPLKKPYVAESPESEVKKLADLYGVAYPEELVGKTVNYQMKNEDFQTATEDFLFYEESEKKSLKALSKEWMKKYGDLDDKWGLTGGNTA